MIRPVADLRIYDTPYGRRRTLTAAYRAGACLSLDDFPAVSSQRLLQSSFFLTCTELISARFLFLRYRGVGTCREKIVSKNAGRIFLPFRLHTILPAFAVLFNSDGRPAFREAHFDILRVLNQSEKLLIAFHPCLLCSDLNARCLKYGQIIARRQVGVQVENAARKLLIA